MGIVHAFRDDGNPSNAQYSVAVIDAYHGLGLARLLTAVLLLDCRREGLREFTVHVLHENKPALALTRSLGGVSRGLERNVQEFEIEIDTATGVLAKDDDVPGLKDVFATFDHDAAKS
ncbi:MAG: GNAT family N-acetyltransferase [Pseudomonadota bacterium]